MGDGISESESPVVPSGDVRSFGACRKSNGPANLAANTAQIEDSDLILRLAHQRSPRPKITIRDLSSSLMT